MWKWILGTAVFLLAFCALCYVQYIRFAGLIAKGLKEGEDRDHNSSKD